MGQAPIAEIESTFDVNFLGAVRCAQAVLPHMRRQGSGTIVNVASVGGRVGCPIQGAYCASKFAMIGFTESLAIEVRQFGIKAVAVLPGFVSTPMLDKPWLDYGPATDDPYADIAGKWSAFYAAARTRHRARTRWSWRSRRRSTVTTRSVN